MRQRLLNSDNAFPAARKAWRASQFYANRVQIRISRLDQRNAEIETLYGVCGRFFAGICVLCRLVTISHLALDVA